MENILTSAVGDGTGVRRSKKVDVEWRAIPYLYFEWLSATIVDAKGVYAGFASYSSICNWGMVSFQPNGSNCTAMIWAYDGSRHLSADIAGETIPSPRETSIAQRLLTNFPNTVDAAPRLVNFFVASGTAASIAIWLTFGSLKRQKYGKF